MRLFGFDLFSFKKPSGVLYDFAQHGLINGVSFDYGVLAYTREANGTSSDVKIGPSQKKESKSFTPKYLYKMKALNKNDFRIQCDKAYLDKNIKSIDSKLHLFGSKPKKNKSRLISSDLELEIGGIKYGREELESIRERLNNRYRLIEFKDILKKYPHTSSQKINEVLTKNMHLRSERAESFIPDFPTDAVDSMREYEDFCIKLCNKKSVFYVIANEKDFKQRNERRDPILLAQSPFGHFWQILGAWDEEMIFLGDL